jgi:hypothetical protein
MPAIPWFVPVGTASDFSLYLIKHAVAGASDSGTAHITDAERS